MKGVLRLVEVKNLTKRYGENAALDNISFSIGGGQVVGLLGLNGAGKTTTMNILTGYISATGGSVTIGGREITHDGARVRQSVGYLPEQPAFYPEMRVDEHLHFICGLKGVKKAEREKQIADVCERVGIAHMRGRMLRNLSKGYRQRVGFAQALIGKPELIVLDEPTVGLDPSQIIEIRKLIKDSGRESTVLVSSHILSEIQAVCGRIIVLHKGRVIADGTPESLSGKMRPKNKLKICVLGEPEAVLAAIRGAEGVVEASVIAPAETGAYDYAALGGEGLDIRVGVFHALAGAGLPLLATYGVGSSLEEAFLGLIGGEVGEKGETRYDADKGCCSGKEHDDEAEGAEA